MTKSPSIVPAFDHDVYLVLDEFERFKVYRETDEAEADKETIIRMICEGQYNKPIRVVCFNTVQGWARDAGRAITAVY